MLVFRRRIGERIVLPESQAAITVVGVRGDVVRLGISAPDEAAVQRLEQRPRAGVRATRPDGGLPFVIRVVIADSDRSQWPQYHTLAENGRIDIRTVGDGTNCITEMIRFRPHLALLEIALPRGPLDERIAELRNCRRPIRLHKQGGRECGGVLQAMSERPDVPVTPVIIMSPIPESTFEDDSLPIIDHICKPVPICQLEQGICALFAYRGWRAQFAREQGSNVEAPVALR